MSWAGIERVLIVIKPCSGWKASHNTNNIGVPVITLSPLAAKRMHTELGEITEFYRSDYHLWSQRKTGKPLA